MKRSINKCLVNDLAYHFAQTQDQWAFSQLYRLLNPFITNYAKKACQRAQRTGLSIPVEDFISFFNQGLYQSTKGYDIGLGDFFPRYCSSLRMREADVWRCYEIRGDIQSDRKYDKARLLQFSLDKPTKDDSDENSQTLLDFFPTPSAETSYMEMEYSRMLLMEFSKLNARYATVVRLLDSGYELSEIASILGESSYNAKMRKLVQRTKVKFGEYLRNRVM